MNKLEIKLYAKKHGIPIAVAEEILSEAKYPLPNELWADKEQRNGYSYEKIRAAYDKAADEVLKSVGREATVDEYKDFQKKNNVMISIMPLAKKYLKEETTAAAAGTSDVPVPIGKKVMKRGKATKKKKKSKRHVSENKITFGQILNEETKNFESIRKTVERFNGEVITKDPGPDNNVDKWIIIAFRKELTGADKAIETLERKGYKVRRIYRNSGHGRRWKVSWK